MKKNVAKSDNNLIDYVISLNPKDNAILIYDRQYDIWRTGKYLGVATWMKDENVGDSFQRSGTRKNEREVFVADTWQLLITAKKSKLQNKP